MSSRRPRILVLFPSHWDRRHLSRAHVRNRYEIVFYGKSLWSFPGGFFRTLRFDAISFVERIVRYMAQGRFDGILSTDEYVGCAIAAAVAGRLGLPTTDLGTMLGLQHKYYARLAQQQCVPEAVPSFELMPVPPPAANDVGLPFPFFVKPVRGSFSIFTAKVDDYEALRRHLKLNVFWQTGLRAMLRPSNELLRHFTDYRVDVNRFIAEGPLEGVQLCVDGFVNDDGVHLMGVVDAVMFPGTLAFERFQYPSRLSAHVQRRVADLVRRLVKGLGINYGQFNAELVYNAKKDSIGVIEVHPRMSYQFADLYSDVDGVDIYEQLLSLTMGEQPATKPSGGAYRHSASMVIRKFGGRRIKTVPGAREIEAFRERWPNARVEIYARRGSMNPEMHAMGSYRCALVNVAANSVDELSQIRATADELLCFDVA